MRLDGNVALVTGAQQGIGRATALRLVADGADVALNILDDSAAAEEIFRAIAAMGRRCALIPADISVEADIQRLVETAERELGVVDVLVNNAGIFPRTPALELSGEQWDQVMGVNLKGAFLCARTVARRLVAAGRPGAIVSVSSVAGFRGSPLGVHYSASKAGVVGMTRSLALALAPHGIRVNAVAPGLIDTAQPRGGSTEEEIAVMSRAVPLGQMGTPEEVTAVIAFLASDDASHITGQVIHVNGGSFAG